MSAKPKSSSRRAFIGILSLIACLGLWLRVQWLLHHYEVFPYVWDDEYSYYVSSAINAFEGRGFEPDYNRTTGENFVAPPMQSFFIWTFYEIFGRLINPLWIKLVQCFLSTIVLCVVLPLSMQFCFGTVAALVAGFFMAVYPPFVHWPSYLMTESNYVTGLAALLAGLIWWGREQKTWQALLFSVLLGALNLQRGNGFFLGIVLAGLALFFIDRRREAVSQAAVFLLVPFLVMSPWLVRNLIRSGDPVWVSSHNGILFHFSNRITLDSSRVKYWETMWAHERPGPLIPEIEQEFRDHRRVLRPEDDKEGILTRGGVTHAGLKTSYYKYSNAYMQVAKRYVVEHPFHFIRNYCIKFWNQFVLVQEIPRRAVSLLSNEIVYAGLHWILLLGGLFGLGWAVIPYTRNTKEKKQWQGKVAVAWSAMFLYFSFFGALFHLTGDGRMNLGLKVFLILGLSLGAQRLANTYISPTRSKGQRASS